MNAPAARRNTAFGAFALLGLAGMVGLLMLGVLGFEEANTRLLLVSSILVCALPAAVLGHLGVTRELTGAEKRIWLRALTGRRAPRAFSDYITSGDRRAMAQRLAEDRRAHRDVQ